PQPLPKREGGSGRPTFPQWLEGAAAGRSFVTTGPMLLLEVDGHKPGDTIEKNGPDPHAANITVRVSSEVAPVTNVQVIVNGRVALDETLAPDKARGGEYRGHLQLSLSKPSWIAARAFSKSPAGNADAESHTNPVYFYIDGRKPYDRESLDEIVARIDGQIEVQKQRDFSKKADVLAYFDHSRDILLKIRETNGIPPGKLPADLAHDELPVLKDPGARTHTEAELKEFLKPIPPKTPAEALKTFETADGFEMQLVAHEPDVVDPIAACFDEDGNLYVCEMRDYPYFPKPGDKPIGTVRLLRDTDGDGVFDESHVFADELLWAGGVAAWNGGVFVAAPPDIWYMQDTDGDFKADVRRKVFTGFGTQNQQAMLNNLTFGLDHKIYGATAGNGGKIRSGNDPASEGVSFDGNDFRFSPDSEVIEPTSGTVQFGNSFDDWGNRYVCSQGNPLEHVVLPLEYLARNPYLPVPKAIHDIAGDRVPIFRISPVERWRLIRSSRRIAHQERDAGATGASQHVVDAAAGVTIYRGGAYPSEYYGNAFVGDAQNNLVHRRILTPAGVTFDSHRAPENSEFVRSSDNWFRPVNFVNAPDGSLYVLDMNREILESIHIPLDVLKFLDLKSGRQTGRIYRIAPKGFKSPPPPHLSTATSKELLAALQSPHGWWRDTAHRLIHERQDSDLIEPLTDLLQKGKMPQSRLHALWSLKGLHGGWSYDVVAAALKDPQPEVRAHAVALAGPSLHESPLLHDLVLGLADDANDRVRFQVAFALGAADDPQGIAALATIARRDADNPWMRTAVLSSAANSSQQLLTHLLDDKSFVKGGKAASMLEQLATVVGVRNNAKDVDGALQMLATNANVNSNGALQQRMVQALGEGLKRAGRHFVLSDIQSPESAELMTVLCADAEQTAADSAAVPAKRMGAIQLLSTVEFARAKAALSALLDATQPLDVQMASLNALSGFAEPEIAALLIANWDHSVPELRLQMIRALLSRESWTLELLQSIRDQKTSAADIDPIQRKLLREHHNMQIRTLADQLFANDSTGPRTEVVASYKKVLEIGGDAGRGQKVFEQNCMVCHRIGDKGFTIGPDLTSTASADREALLAHILDPNRYVLPNFIQYVVVDVNGQLHTGIIAAQTATSITLKQERDATETILRSGIEELKATGKSLMPEGFEKKIPLPEMADLIAFLEATRLSGPKHGPRLDIGTEPGLVEPD
ncbi:MAG: PVC-type heme-binding CxxCH protein, partial [Planctomycetaceae bacterium]